MSFSQNSSSSTEAPLPEGLAALLDVVCDVEVVLGTGSMTVRECLNLKRQSIIRLNESAGSDMRVIVNGIAVADGEIVIVDNGTALRVTDVLAPPSNEVLE
jgi:flagellar motor switch protein FliN